MDYLESSFMRRRRRQSMLSAGFAAIATFAHPAASQTFSASSPVLTLRALLDSVQANHPTVQAAMTRIRAAEGSRTTARAFGNPILSYQVDQTPFPGGRPLPDMAREAMTTATFPLEPLYQRGPRTARANAEVRAAQADAASTKQRLGLEAANAYYRVAMAQIQVATTHDLVSWLDTLVTYNRSRVEEGAAAEADLIRSELERDRMSAERAMQDAELAQARSALTAFVSDTRNRNPLPSVVVDNQPMPLPSSIVAFVQSGESTPGALASHRLTIAARPDVRAARERVAASTAGVSAERSMLFRQVGATIGTMQTAGTTSMIAGISVPIPLFDPNRGEIQRASAERDAAASELAAQERGALAEVRGAYEAARVLSDRATTLAHGDSNSFLARADESRRIALGAYREGAVPLFQVIDAARAWSDARMTYYRTVLAQHQSILNLIVAEGLDLFSTLPALAVHGDTLR